MATIGGFFKCNIDTYDASMTHGLRPSFDWNPFCMFDSRFADEKTARLRAKWLSLLPGDCSNELKICVSFNLFRL